MRIETKGRLRTLLGVCLALASSWSYAVPISYSWDFLGTCSLGCGVIGLSSGDTVSGAILATDDGDGVIDTSELDDYWFTLGSYGLSSSDSSAFAGLIVNGDGSGFSAGVLTVWSASTGFFLDLPGLSHWSFTPSGSWFPGAIGKNSWHGGGGTVAVPEPDALALLGAGLVVLAWSARRRAGRKLDKPKKEA